MCLDCLISHINEVSCSILETVLSVEVSDEICRPCPQRDQTISGGGREVEDRQVNVIVNCFARAALHKPLRSQRKLPEEGGDFIAFYKMTRRY